MTSRPNLLRENLALCSSAALVLIAGIRIYAFADFNVTNALAILGVADYFKVLFSSLIAVLSLLASFLLLFYIVSSGFRAWLAPKDGESPHWYQIRFLATVVPIFFVGFFTLNNLYSIIFSVCILWYMIFRKVQKKRQRHKGKRAGVASLSSNWLIVPALVPAIFQLLISTPWTPLEAIQIKKAESPISGYLIGESSGQTMIILKHKTPVWVKSEDIEQRQVCHDTHWLTDLTIQAVAELLSPDDSKDPTIGKDLCAVAGEN